MKSASDCLNFIDSTILCSIEKHASIKNLENLRNYMMEIYIDKHIEEMLDMLAILSQINLIIERYCLANESDIKQLNHDLRNYILDWLEASNTKREDGTDK